MKLCFDTELHKNVAIKCVNRSKLNKSYKDKNTIAYKMLQNEIAVLKKMQHPNIVQLINVIDDSESSFIYLVTEYFPHGSLLSLTKAGRNPDKVLNYARQLVDALDYANSVAGILHRSLFLHNLLLDSSENVQIADFGLKFMLSEEEENMAAASYLAPELCRIDGYRTYKTDVWALGVCLYFLAKGEFPFAGGNTEQIMRAIKRNR